MTVSGIRKCHSYYLKVFFRLQPVEKLQIGVYRGGGIVARTKAGLCPAPTREPFLERFSGLSKNLWVRGMVRVFISLSPWEKAGGAFICSLTDASLAWLERANFVNVRDLRDPAVLAAVALGARNGAVYCAKRGLQTAYSALSNKPFLHHASMGAKREGSTARWAVAGT